MPFWRFRLTCPRDYMSPTHTCTQHTHAPDTHLHPRHTCTPTHLHPTHTCTRHTHAPNTNFKNFSKKFKKKSKFPVKPKHIFSHIVWMCQKSSTATSEITVMLDVGYLISKILGSPPAPLPSSGCMCVLGACVSQVHVCVGCKCVGVYVCVGCKCVSDTSVLGCICVSDTCVFWMQVCVECKCVSGTCNLGDM